MSLAAPIEWLKELKDGTELTISVKVNLDGIASELTATACPPRIYNLRGTQRDENFDNVPPQLIGPLETLDTGAISIINQSSTGSLKIVTFNRDSASGAIEGNVLINESAVTKFRIELKAPVQRLSFHYADVQATQGKILFYGPGGYIDERPLISSAGISQLIFSAANINYIEFYNGGEEQVIFDNFMFN